MSIRTLLRACVLLLPGVLSAQISETITYQGYLEDGGQPASGQYDFEFIQIALPGGSQSDPVELDNVQVTDGVFTVDMGFSNSFNLQDYELQISVRTGSSTGPYTLLAPNTPVRAAPLATTASFAGYAAAVPNNSITSGNLQAGSVTSAKIANGAVGSSQIDSSQVQRRVTGTCAPGSSIQSISDTGTVTCETDDVGGNGDITGVTAGTGLAGGGTSGDVAVSIANSGVGNAQIANGAVGSSKIANGAVGSAQIDASQVQARVSGSCVEGIVSISAAGVPTCVSNASTVTTVTFLTESGLTNLSMAIKSDGNVLIVGYLSGPGDLVAYACQDRGCSTRTRTVIDASVNDVGRYADVVIVGGRAYVGYYDATNGDLKIAACSDETCVSSTILVADSVGDVGQFVKGVVDPIPLPAFVYYDATNGDLKVAGCGSNCATTTITTLDNSANDVGRGIAAVFFNSSLYVAYQDATAAQVKVAWCFFNVSCQGAPTLTSGAASSAGEIPIASVVLVEGRFGYFFRSASGISFQYCLEWVQCNTLSAPSVLNPAIPHAIDASRDALGYPVVAATLTTNRHVYFRCRSDHCGEGIAIGSSLSIQAQPAVVRGPDGLPRTAFPTSTGLVYHYCSNEFCSGSLIP